MKVKKVILSGAIFLGAGERVPLLKLKMCGTAKRGRTRGTVVSTIRSKCHLVSATSMCGGRRGMKQKVTDYKVPQGRLFVAAGM